MHRATHQFWQWYALLPESVQRSADKSFQLLREHARHPSLQFKKVGDFWSASVGLAHRALAVEDDSGFTWVWIGSHDEYRRMIQGR
jgi:hypothetical protein